MISFQSAQRGDAELIDQLMHTAFQEYQKTSAPSSAMEETAASIAEAMDAGEQALIAIDGEQPVGMIRYIFRQNEVYFYRLSVIPGRQGQGIAKRLLKALEDIARSERVPVLVCRVRKNIARNMHLYQSIGYRLVKEESVHKATGQNIPVVTMEKIIHR
ncbi:MAG: GNAT family N-acetyltransferase [Sporolactobacillus sp.]